MPETFTGKVKIQNAGGDTRIALNGNTGDIDMGGYGKDGSLRCYPKGTTAKTKANATIRLAGEAGDIDLGTIGKAGDLFIRDQNGDRSIRLSGSGGRTSGKKERVVLRGESADIVLGGGGANGNVFVRNADGEPVIFLDGGESDLVVGSKGKSGDVFIRDENGDRSIRLSGSGRTGSKNERVVLRGENADIVVGGGGVNGDVFVRNAEGEDVIRLDGESGEIKIKNWAISVPDEVFSPDYSLRPLAEVSSYINEYSHLPDIPSGEEVQREGVEVTSFSMSLLRKVEELTLYVLQQQEQLGDLIIRVKKLECENDEGRA